MACSMDSSLGAGTSPAPADSRAVRAGVHRDREGSVARYRRCRLALPRPRLPPEALADLLDLEQAVALRVPGTRASDLPERARLPRPHRDEKARAEALRERQADLPALIEEFVAANERGGRARISFTPDALAALARHPWPGNVRELANLIERLSILHGGQQVDACDLPLRYRPGIPDRAPSLPMESLAEPAATADGALSEIEVMDLLESPIADAAVTELPAEGIDLRRHLDAIERSLVQQALERSGGTVAHAARLLGLRRTTLVEKLRKLGEPGERGGVLTAAAACGASM